MQKSRWKLLPLTFGVILTQSVSAEERGAYVPFVAVDAANGSFDKSIRDELDRSNIGYESLSSPINSEQLKGANIILISGDFRGVMTKPKEGERDHRLYSNEEISTIADFVKNGGVLIGAGMTWSWTSYGGKPTESYPLNLIGEALDFSIRGGCTSDMYERKLLKLLKGQTAPERVAFSTSFVDFKGSYDKFVRERGGECAGGGDKRGGGYIYIFGHQGILNNSPEIVSSVFLGLSPQKRPDADLVDNNPKEPEIVEEKETASLPQTTPKVAVSNINPLDLLAQEGSNMIAWVTSPLDVDIPDNFRANISLLREDLLDGHAKGSASPEAYQSAVELCDNLMACIDKKEKQQIDAKLRVAQAKQRSPLSNQALEARRNYLMSWPQYNREVRQREVLAEEKGDNTEVKASELELAWIEKAGTLRKALDVKYSAYRAALRKK